MIEVLPVHFVEHIANARHIGLRDGLGMLPFNGQF